MGDDHQEAVHPSGPTESASGAVPVLGPGSPERSLDQTSVPVDLPAQLKALGHLSPNQSPYLFFPELDHRDELMTLHEDVVVLGVVSTFTTFF